MGTIATKFKKFESVSSDYKAVELGKLCEVFQEYSFKFQDKNVGKRATFVFFDSEGNTCNVVLSKKLDAMYRAGQVDKLQLIGCKVVEMDLINPDTNELIEAGVMRLQAPASGLATFKDLVAKDYIDAIAGF